MLRGDSGQRQLGSPRNQADALAASIRSSHASYQFHGEGSHAHGRSVRRESRVLARHVSHTQRHSIIGRNAQGVARLPATSSFRSHFHSMHDGLVTIVEWRVRFHVLPSGIATRRVCCREVCNPLRSRTRTPGGDAS